MFNKILLAYNGSREGKSALLACAEIASFAKSETHLLVVAGMPSSMFLTEGFLPEELLEEEKKRAQEVLNEGIEQLKKKGFAVTGHLAVGEPVEEICLLLVARVGRKKPARPRALQHFRRADAGLRRNCGQRPKAFPSPRAPARLPRRKGPPSRVTFTFHSRDGAASVLAPSA